MMIWMESQFKVNFISSRGGLDICTARPFCKRLSEFSMLLYELINHRAVTHAYK